MPQAALFFPIVRLSDLRDRINALEQNVAVLGAKMDYSDKHYDQFAIYLGVFGLILTALLAIVAGATAFTVKRRAIGLAVKLAQDELEKGHADLVKRLTALEKDAADTVGEIHRMHNDMKSLQPTMTP